MLYTLYDYVLGIELFDINLPFEPVENKNITNGKTTLFINKIDGNKLYVTKI